VTCVVFLCTCISRTSFSCLLTVYTKDVIANMSSKFFTWTKGDRTSGDRRNASETALRSSGIVPIPAECITIHGMDYSRNKQASRLAKWLRSSVWILTCNRAPVKLIGSRYLCHSIKVQGPHRNTAVGQMNRSHSTLLQCSRQLP